ncbi:sensor histidine kinase [Salinibacter sp.]|uniref:sensor histidine kinase n=1 Tax=Salinibacter sp. TaxID=2065818 RepID=UPI0021E765F2|nr:ATP-binding protein [Salinibacter sp.]
MEGDSLKMIPGGSVFADVPVYMMEVRSDGSLILATQSRGLLVQEGDAFRSLAPELTSFLDQNNLYHGTSLPGGRYALATIRAGVVVVNSSGEVVRVLDDSSGLPVNVVNHVFSGREGQLWMALNNGQVFQAGLSVPLTVHDERTSLRGTIRGVHKHRGTTYVATETGLYVLTPTTDQSPGAQSAQFESWGGDLPVVLDMKTAEGDLLAATQQNGLYHLEGRTKRQIGGWERTWSLTEDSGGDQLYAATTDGVKRVARRNGQWTAAPISGLDTEIRSVASREDGTLWASTFDDRVIRASLSPDGRSITDTISYGTEAGLPEGYKGVHLIDSTLTIASSKGLYQIENPAVRPERRTFTRQDALLPKIEGESPMLKSFYYKNGRLWVVLGNRVFVGEVRGQGVADWDEIAPLHFPKSEAISVFVDDVGTLWLGDQLRLFRYAARAGADVPDPAPPGFVPLIRRVIAPKDNRLLYGGTPHRENPGTPLPVRYGEDLRVRVASPQYGTTTPPEYRYRLLGRDDEWSDWSSAPTRRFNDFWEGTYRLQVQARNERGQLSRITSFPLEIIPPWYRSIWAYLVYGLGFLGLAYGARRFYVVKEEKRQARRRVQKLERERVVAERLKKANDRLREANRLKEDFLATTSHELRTPLTNILGSLEVLRGMMEGEETEFLDMIEENGKRLKRTLNALLDLSMLRSGEEDVELTPTPLDACVERVASDLRADAEEKGLSFRVALSGVPAWADLDEQYLEQILRNLIENAIKYTDEGVVAVSTGTAEGRVYVEVEDTGIGIDEAFLPDLFEEFKQESRGRSRTYEGNGLGLAISARLADQMDGAIRVETEKHEGSRFRVEFPRSSEPAEAGAEG